MTPSTQPYFSDNELSTVLILASTSPRRREILSNAGFAFEVRDPLVQENRLAGETAGQYVLRLSREKAQAVDCGENEIVLGADTVVLAAGEILEKPRDAPDATRMLALLSGAEHEVITGICLRDRSNLVSGISTTRVRFSHLTGREIAEYVASGEPMDKAGAYAIQGLASKFIDRIEGCYFNVVGLPVALVYARLKEFLDAR